MNVNVLKSIVWLAVAPVLFFVVPQTTFSQTEKLDIIEYTPPKGWTKTPKEDLIVYSTSNKTGGLCIITVYPSTASAGDAQQDFAKQWNDLVVKPFKPTADPKTQVQTANGWTSITAASQIESDGIKSAVMMTVVSGYGRTASILAILNNQEYLPSDRGFYGRDQDGQSQSHRRRKTTSNCANFSNYSRCQFIQSRGTGRKMGHRDRRGYSFGQLHSIRQ